MARVFLCYRREDTAGWSGRIYDRLVPELGQDQVFIDVATLQPGQDFAEVIRATISDCDVLIAVIGPEWTRCVDDSGRRRLDDPNDFIRREIATALECNVRVIPVLMADTKMPTAEELPPDLAELPQLHALEVTASRFDWDVSCLIESIDPTRKPGKKTLWATAWRWPALGLGAVVVIAVAWLVLDGLRGGRDETNGSGGDPPIADVSGEWQGKYWYPGVLNLSPEPIPFTAELVQDGSRITGHITEVVKSMSEGGIPSIDKLLSGEISIEELTSGEAGAAEGVKTSVREVEITEGAVGPDGRVTFVKQYKGQDNMYDRVEYEGILSSNGKRLSGTWRLVSGMAVSGTFEMSRE